MKSVAGTSVFVLGVLIFLLLAMAVYVFRSMPYLLGVVLLGEILVLAAAILAPVLGGSRKGWFGRAVFALIAVALANLYMLFLAQRWGVEPQGWYRTVLHWQDWTIGVVLGVFRFVTLFLDAVLKAVLNLHEGPIGAFLAKLRPPSALGLAGSIPGAEGVETLPFGMIWNLLLGVLGSLWTASVVKGVLPRTSGKSAAHH